MVFCTNLLVHWSCTHYSAMYKLYCILFHKIWSKVSILDSWDIVINVVSALVLEFYSWEYYDVHIKTAVKLIVINTNHIVCTCTGIYGKSSWFFNISCYLIHKSLWYAGCVFSHPFFRGETCGIISLWKGTSKIIISLATKGLLF